MEDETKKPGKRRATGFWAEDLVAKKLESSGYEILDRNFYCPGGELDLVAMQGETLCFIEVRFRSDVDAGEPLETVRGVKQRRLLHAARLYLSSHPRFDPMRQIIRFDVVSVVGKKSPRVEIVTDAFGSSEAW